MAGEWRDVALKDVADELTVGYVGPMASEYVDNGIPFLRSLNVEPLRINKNDLKFITPEFHLRIQKSRLKPGDVVIVRTGKPGACSVVPNWLADANCSDLVIVRCGKQLNNRFLAYYVNTVATGHVAAHLVGAVQQHFNVGSARTLRINLPPLAEQKAIAAVLGALDDKIELNRRMNTTLEAMARALFQSWFVDFDPVHAKLDGRPPAALDPATAALFPDSFQDSHLGYIPMGWVIRPLAEAFDIKDGATFKKEDRLESGSIIAFGANGPVGFSTRANVTEPCIALGKIGSCGSLHRSWNPCWITNNAFVVKPHRGGSLEFMWRTLCTIDFTQFIGGSANPYMPLKNFGHTPVVMPPAPLLTAYQERAGSLAAKIVANDEQSRTLATLRDTLLPRLLSGELSVKDILSTSLVKHKPCIATQ